MPETAAGDGGDVVFGTGIGGRLAGQYCHVDFQMR